jgi:ATP-dependent Zn protease
MDKITFDEVAGYEDEKIQAKKYVRWLRNYDLYRKEGAYLPKGVLLCGAPGVGKTMFAKAIASESEVNFVEAKLCGVTKLCDTINEFANAFMEAKKHIPSILFIDEIDQLIGREANGFDSDERRRLVDFLLQELDGASTSEGVLVIATCNNRRLLPSALLRSGRMDNHIQFDMPNLENREKILDLYLSKSRRFDKIDRNLLAISCDGLQCADLKSICNTVLIQCIDEDKDYATMDDFDNVVSCLIEKDIPRKREKKKRKDYVAYHELAHFAVYYHYYHCACAVDIDLGKNRSACTRSVLEMDENYENHVHLIDINLAGREGEAMFCKSLSIGCKSDMENASSEYMTLTQELGCHGLDKVNVTNYEKSDHYRQRREESQAAFFEERRKIVQEILKEEKPLIDFLFPIVMKKGFISFRTMKFYLSKYERRSETSN